MSDDTETITVATVSEGPGGDGDPGTDIALPVVELLTGRGFITGKSGSGKSNTASVIAEKLLDNGFGLLIVDIDGEYYGLKEEYEILHAGGDEECDIQVTTEHAEKLASLALEQNVPIILDVSSFLDEEQARDLLTEVARHLFAKAKKRKQPFLMLVEEIHEYIPEKGGVDECGRMLIKIGKRGRKHGLGITGISQRPADVKKDFITQCDWLVWHRLTWNNDTKVVRRILDGEHADAVEDLQDGEGFLVTDWAEAVRRVQFYRKKTFDAGATPGLDDFERPDLKSVSDDLVSDLQEISEENQQREDRIQELREQLDEKNSKIADLQRELQDARDLSRMAEQFVDAMVEHVEGASPGKPERQRMRERHRPTVARRNLHATLGDLRQTNGNGSTPASSDSSEDEPASSRADESVVIDSPQDGIQNAWNAQTSEMSAEAEGETVSTDEDTGDFDFGDGPDDEGGTDGDDGNVDGDDDSTLDLEDVGVPAFGDDADVDSEDDTDDVSDEQADLDGSEDANSDSGIPDFGFDGDDDVPDFGFDEPEDVPDFDLDDPDADVPDFGFEKTDARTSGDTSASEGATGRSNDGRFTDPVDDAEEPERDRADGPEMTGPDEQAFGFSDASEDETSDEDVARAIGGPNGDVREHAFGDAPEFIGEIRSTIQSLDKKTTNMLTYYRDQGPAKPMDAHFVAGGSGDRTDAYAHNRTLRTAGLIEHVGRGHYDYRLRDLLSEKAGGHLDDSRVDAYLEALEALFVPRREE